MSAEDLLFTPVAELAALIRGRQISPVELVQAHLRRIDSLDVYLHSYITVCREDALRAARAAEQVLAKGEA